MPTATTKRPHRRGKTDTVNGRQGRRGGAPDSARKARRSESVKRRRTVAAQPYFDVELRELWLGDVLVKRLDARATNQILMLTSFQEQRWALRIDDPLRPKNGSDGKSRLRYAVFNLNRHQHPEHLIRFSCDGSGRGVRWDLARLAATIAK